MRKQGEVREPVVNAAGDRTQADTQDEPEDAEDRRIENWPTLMPVIPDLTQTVIPAAQQV